MNHCEAVDLRWELVEKGYAVVPGVLDSFGLAAAQHAARQLLDNAPPDHFAANRTTGSMLSIAAEPGFAEVIAWPKTLQILRSLGFGQLAWSAGYVISKPAGGPRLFWHQDWLWWTHPISASAIPHQLFAMYYLVDTDRRNGCLRVVPHSHRQRLPAHEQLLRAHSAEALAGNDQSDPAFSDMEGEVDVPVRAGDLLLGDSRLLHAAHGNNSESNRTLITLWYHPAYEQLPGAIQAFLAEKYGGSLNGWKTDKRNRIDCLLPYGAEGAPAWPICRDPHVAMHP